MLGFGYKYEYLRFLILKKIIIIKKKNLRFGFEEAYRCWRMQSRRIHANPRKISSEGSK